MFNDEESRRRSAQIHAELKRQQQAIRDQQAKDAAQARQRPPSQVREQLSQYRRKSDR